MHVHHYIHKHISTSALNCMYVDVPSPPYTHIQIHTLLVMGRCKREGKKQMANQYVEEKKWDFRFDLKEVSEEELLEELWLVD